MGLIITGGSSGIGAAVARALASDQRRIMLCSQGTDAASLDRLQVVADDCRRAGADVETFSGDLAVPGCAVEIAVRTRARFGSVTGIVHAAGFADRRSIVELPRDALERSFGVIALAFHELIASSFEDLALMGRDARVVAVSSFVAHRFVVGGTFAASAAAKAALEALVRVAAIELAPTGGTANAVAPGFTRKDAGRVGALTADTWTIAAQANPLARLAEPEEVAAAIAFLLSSAAGHITGVVLPIDGGLTLA